MNYPLVALEIVWGGLEELGLSPAVRKTNITTGLALGFAQGDDARSVVA
jgi:hypothetical protein